MKQIVLLDSARLDGKPTRTPQGFLKVPAVLASVGVVTYNVGGKIVRELRPPKEVLADESVRTALDAPVTNGHPYEYDPPLVDPYNSKVLLAGHISGVVRADAAEGLLRGDVIVTDAKANQDVENGKKALSPGYTRVFDPTPGEWRGINNDQAPVAYDGVQREIRYNHFALCEAGRQGPKVRLMLDGMEGGEVELICLDSVETETGGNPKRQGGESMKKITIAGKTYEVDDAVTARMDELDQAGKDALALAKENETAAAQAKTDSAEQKKAADKAKGEADAAKAEAAGLRAKMDAADDPKKSTEAAECRMKVLATAKVLLDSKGYDEARKGTDLDVMKAVVKADDATVKMDESADYFRARFDSISARADVRAKQDKAMGDLLSEGRETKSDASDFAAKQAERRKKIEDRVLQPVGFNLDSKK